MPVEGGLFVLSPADMVLHAATHLFLENPAGQLRDLLDLHDLLTLFAQRPGFWDGLLERAHHHELGRPLYYGLRYAAALLGTDVPACRPEPGRNGICAERRGARANGLAGAQPRSWINSRTEPWAVLPSRARRCSCAVTGSRCRRLSCVVISWQKPCAGRVSRGPSKHGLPC